MKIKFFQSFFLLTEYIDSILNNTATIYFFVFGYISLKRLFEKFIIFHGGFDRHNF